MAFHVRRHLRGLSHMNCRFALIVALAVAPLAAIPLRAQATAPALSLNGVRRVNLRFLLTEDDIAAGVDTGRLRGVIEDKLRSKNIALVPGRSGGDGTVGVNVGVNVGAIRSTTSASVTFFN